MPCSKFALGVLVGTILLTSARTAELTQRKQLATPAAREAESAFERLAQLVGDWQLASPNPQVPAGKVVVRYQLTAGGSAVVETLFPGSEKEMVSVYYRDGDQLVMTHYCHCGNQPRMRAQPGATPDELVFEFMGGGNLDPAKDTHMHGLRVQFIDRDHFRTEWELYIKGKSAVRHGLDLVRAK